MKYIVWGLRAITSSIYYTITKLEEGVGKMKKFKGDIFSYIIIIGGIAFMAALIFFLVTNEPETQADYLDTAANIVIENQKFDTTAINNWCGEPTGTIRMVGAWFYDENTFEDETGNFWSYDNVSKEAFYLLWIDDVGTPEVHDDEIIKVWQEKI